MTFTTVTTPKRPDLRRSVSSIESRRHNDIDQEIRKFEDAVRELKSKRNALAIISKLPPEILSKIFLICAAHPPDVKPSLSWIKVSHVSRHWRAVALGCPSLWSSLVFSSSTWAQEMLRRSKMAPLVINADLTLMTPKMIAAVQNALQHISRTTHLQFTATNGTMDKLLGSLEQPAPLLQSLTVSNTYPSSHYQNERYSLPANFLNGDAPCLQEMHLVRCSIPWDSPLFHNLTSLIVFDTGLQFRPTIDELLSTLEKMPKLQSLSLTDCLPTLADDATAAPLPLRVVELPLLIDIHLSSETLECANLLNHISFSGNARVRLLCRGTDASGHDFSSLTESLSRWLNSSGYKSTQAPLKRLQVDHHDTNTVRLLVWNSGGTDTKLPSCTPVLEVEMSWRHFESNSLEPVVSTICSVLPLSQLRVLHVRQLEVLPSSAWASAFGGFSEVRKIELSGQAGHALVSALGTEKEAKDQSKSSIIFPVLRSVIFHDIDMETDGESTLRPLADYLRFRAERGTKVNDISLTRCDHVSEEEVERLREVASVHWDGLALSSDEEEDYERFFERLEPYVYSDEELFGL